MNTILVVDDSPFIVDVFVTMLERGGYRTIAAYGGEECLEILKTVTPDLILLDIMMEPMDGWETLDHIKSDPVTRDLPVLMFSAKKITPEEAQEHCLNIEDFVSKPVNPAQLLDAIKPSVRRADRAVLSCLGEDDGKLVAQVLGRLLKRTGGDSDQDSY